MHSFHYRAPSLPVCHHHLQLSFALSNPSSAPRVISLYLAQQSQPELAWSVSEISKFRVILSLGCFFSVLDPGELILSPNNSEHPGYIQSPLAGQIEEGVNWSGSD